MELFDIVIKPFARKLKKGPGVKITTFLLKIIALTAMLLDHLEGSFPAAFPVAFGWIGRIAIPIFMYCVVQGLIHTSNTRRYLLRLYIGSAIMSVGSFVLDTAFSDAPFQTADNIFAVFFILAVLVALSKCKLTMSRKVGLWTGFILTQIVSFLLITQLQTISKSYGYLANGLLPNILKSEGSLIFIGLGIFMYIFRNNRVKFAIMYSLFCILMFATASFGGFTVQNLLYGNYQWMMILALPLMLAYNGERGKSMKYFFYAFYPLHIWILFIISSIVQRK